MFKDCRIIFFALGLYSINIIKNKSLKKPKTKHRKINVLFSINNLLTGGAQQSVKNFALSLNKEFFNVFVCKTKGFDKEEPLSKEIQKAGIKVFDLRLTDLRKPSDKQQFIDLLKECEIDVLHSMLDPFDRWGSVLAKQADVPVSIIKKASTYLSNDALETRFINKIIDKFFVDKFISVSKTVSNYLIKYENVSPKKITLIPNPVDTKYFAPERGNRIKIREEFGIKPTTILVGNTSRFVERKGINYFLETASEVCKKISDIRFVLAGWGKEEENLKKLASDLNIEQKILFIKPRRDIVDLLSAFDIFLFTSIKGEGLPNSMLEAMAMSKPIIASNVGSNYELIENNLNGLLPTPSTRKISVSFLNTKELSKAVIELAENPTLREKLGTEARKKANAFFSTDVVVKKLEKLYIKLLSEKKESFSNLNYIKHTER